MNITNKQEIEGIGNYYGGLNIGECEGRFYWSIENYDGDYWVEIPETLYRELTALVEAK